MFGDWSPASGPVVPLVAVAVLGVALIVLLAAFRRSGRPAGDHYSPGMSGGSGGLDEWRRSSRRWASRRDVAELVSAAGDSTRLRIGLLLDGGRRPVLLRARAFRSKMVCAPSGSGKTHRVVVPDIIEHDGPVISVSVKPDVLALTWRARAAKGRVWVFDPTDQIAASPGLASSVRRVRWSPLLGVDCYAAAARAAADLCKSAKTSGQQMAGRDFWDAMGRMVVGPVLFAAAVTGTAITEAAQWVLDPAAEAEVEDILVRALDQPGARPWDRAALTDWRGFKGSEERNKSSVRLTAKPILEAWGRAEIAASVDVRAKDPDRPVLDVEQLLDGGSDSLFVVAPAADQEAFRPVFETLLNALLRRIEAKAQQGMGRPLDPPLLLSLDEAGNIAAIQDLGRVVSKAAAEGVIVETVWQDLAQMVALYGPALATVVQSNHWCQMFLPGINDQSTLRAVSAMVGQDARWSEQRSWSRSSGRSGSVAERLEDVAPPDYIRATPRGQAIVVSGEHPAMRVALPAWWEDPGLRKRIAPDAAALFDGLYGAPKKTRKTRRGRGRP